MRLIDRDKLYERMNQVYPEYWESVLEEMSTVERIPVTWLMEWGMGTGISVLDGDECQMLVDGAEIINELIADWREEQGNDRSD